MPAVRNRLDPRATQTASGDGSVLLLSMRRLAKLVAYCIEYEFEDVIAELTAADRIEADDQAGLEFSRRVYRYTRLLSGSKRVARALTTTRTTFKLERDYELFFPVFNHVHELFALACIPEWRKRCRVAACYISELWLHQLPHYLVEMLAEFDHIFLGVIHPVKEVAQIAGRPCTYLPLAADVLKFSPFPGLPERFIEVCNLGRRSKVTHEALLRVAKQQDFMYHYDTVAASGMDLKQITFRVQDAAEHRFLLASVLRRSRYYFAYRGFVNAPEFTKGRDEISARFYEGAAAGTVMLGEPPDTAQFKSEFDWDDVVIPVPFDCPDIGRIINELDADPQRLARIRRNNVANAALRHDWVYRLRTVLQTLDIPVTEAMLAREKRLQVLASQALDPMFAANQLSVRSR